MNGVLVTMNGISIITTDDLEREKEKLCKINPSFEKAYPLMDPQLVNRLILEGLIFQKIVKKYITENKLDELQEYKTALELYQGEENRVNYDFFCKQFIVTIDDRQVQDFYEENKERLFWKRSEDPTILNESEYLDYESIKDEIKKVLKAEKQKELANQEIDRLKELYKVEVNEDFLK